GGFCTDAIHLSTDLISKPAPTRIFFYLEIPKSAIAFSDPSEENAETLLPSLSLEVVKRARER
ncbi:MAG: hypothetical protein LDL41_17170, partial [Coleofasciculus sp. S288]|nr:hypothetical protein [Coleofasciculus sp. S288]